MLAEVAKSKMPNQSLISIKVHNIRILRIKIVSIAILSIKLKSLEMLHKPTLQTQCHLSIEAKGRKVVDPRQGLISHLLGCQRMEGALKQIILVNFSIKGMILNPFSILLVYLGSKCSKIQVANPQTVIIMLNEVIVQKLVHQIKQFLIK